MSLSPQANQNPFILSSAFLTMAQQFFSAYQILKQTTNSINWPGYFCFCHALEIGMKAFLISKGVTLEKGHKLVATMLKCQKHGLTFSPSEQACIEALREPHSEYWARYPKEDWSDKKGVPTVEQYENDALSVLNKISTDLTGAKLF